MSNHFQNLLQMTNNQNSTFDDKESEKFYHKIENDNENLDSISSNPIISTPSNSALNNSDVCRDYLRNTCRRGNNCKFSHPELSHDGKKNDIMLLTFCHDFQNRECRRNNCKFIHCSKQEEETYKATGKLPSSVNMNNQGNNQNPNKFGPKKFNNNYQQNNFKDSDVPVCIDFIKGDCFRGVRCKFRHVNKNDNQDRNFKNGNNYDNPFENKPYMPNMPNNCDNRYMMQRFDQMNQLKPNLIQNHMNSGMNRDNSFPLPMNRRNSGMRMFEPEAKRRAFDSGYNTPTTFTFANNTNNLCVTTALNHHNQIHQSHSNGTSTANTDTSSTTAATAAVAAAAAAAAINEFNGSNVSTAATANTITRSMYSNLSDNRYLYEENNVLRRRIDELKQQVGDLMNANEFLLEQNAQLRSLANVLPATTVSQKQLQNNLHTVSTTLHNQVSAMHSTSVQKPPSSNPGSTNSQPPPPPIPIGPPTMGTTDLLVAANHLHRQQQQQQNQQQRAAAVAAVAAAAVAATSGAVSSMSSGVVPSSASGLSAASSISAMTTSTSTPLVSYPIMTASIPHSLGHLTH